MRTGAEVAEALLDGERIVGVRTDAGRGAARRRRRPRHRRLVGQARVAARARPPAGAPGQGPDPRAARARRRPPCERIVASERVYLVPRPDGRLIVGATVEERASTPTVTAGGVHELLREAYRLLPDVAEMELVEAMAGLRPGTPDNLPLIGPGALDGLVLADRPLPQRHPAGAADRARRSPGCSRAASCPSPSPRRAPTGSAMPPRRGWRGEDRAERRAARAGRGRDAGRRGARERRRAGGAAASPSRSTARSSRAASGRRRRCARAAERRGPGRDPGRRRRPGSWAGASGPRA